MGSTSLMFPLRTASLLAVLALATPVAATNVCVSCTGPDAVYNCTVKNADTIAGLAGDKALRKICTKILKRSVPHASCNVLKTSGACPGKAKTVGWDDVKDAAASEAEKLDKPDKPDRADKAGKPDAADTTKPAGSPPAKAVAAPPNNPDPASAPVQSTPAATEAGARTKDAKAEPKDPPPPKVEPPPGAATVTSPDTPSVQDGLKGAGDNIKNAAEKTWDCVSSLFGKC